MDRMDSSNDKRTPEEIDAVRMLLELSCEGFINPYGPPSSHPDPHRAQSAPPSSQTGSNLVQSAQSLNESTPVSNIRPPSAPPMQTFSTVVAASRNTSGKNTKSRKAGTGKKAVPFGLNRRVTRASKDKHRPIGPKGTVFLEKGNLDLDRSRVSKGNPENSKLQLVFKDNEGRLHFHPYIDKDAQKWDDSKWVGDVNKWRNQAIRRAFKRDPFYQGYPSRTRWSAVERKFLEYLIKDRVQYTGMKLNGRDWRKIAKHHNAEWKGEEIQKGDILVNGTPAKSTQTIGERTPNAINATYERDSKLVKTVKDLLPDDDEYADTTDTETEDAPVGEPDSDLDMDSEDGEEEGGHGGEIDPDIEHHSDDEKDHQRPASQPNAGRLIPTC